MNRFLNNRTLAVAIHIIVWLFLASLLVFLMTASRPRGIDFPHTFFTRMGIYFIFMVIIFYLNYAFLIEKFLFQNRTWLYLFAILILLLSAISVHFLINNWFLEPLPRRASIAENTEPGYRIMVSPERNSGPLMQRVFPDSAIGSSGPRIFSTFFPFFIRPYGINILSLLFVLAVGTCIKLSIHRFHSERQKEQADKEKLQTELSFLKSQINPHFFFNMLNNIYSLIRSNPDTAQETVHKLSRLMRYVLYDSSKEMVTLREEIEFIENYIELAKIRISKKTTVRFTPSVGDPETLVPPLLYIPFLENIFKHGVRQSETSTITISLRQTSDSIMFTSQNKIFNNQTQVVHGEGIGLNNVKRRLELLYDDNYSLIIRTNDGFFKVHLTIPVYEN